MPTATAPRRRFRLQFSLRALLAFMFIMGLAITIYRWPWEETRPRTIRSGGLWGRQWWQPPGEDHFDPSVDYGVTETTTYRRGWNGVPLRDGLQRIYVRGRLVEERPYRNGALSGTNRCFDWSGRLTCETDYRNGKLEGPFRVGDGNTWVQTGNFSLGLEQGVWETIEERSGRYPPMYLDGALDERDVRYGEPHGGLEMPDDPIVCRSEWQQGKRHGNWEWRTRNGKLLNRAEYVNDHLHRWNGQLVNETFQRWLATVTANDPVLQAALQLPSTSSYGVMNMGVLGTPDDFFVTDGGGEAWMYLTGQPGLPVDEPTHRVLHFTHLRKPSIGQYATEEITLGEYLLEWALQEGLTFEFRHSGLWLVPAGESSGEIRDLTGVAQVKFEPGSLQERAWEEPVTLSPYRMIFFRYTLIELFRDTGIELDLSDLEPLPQTADPDPDLLSGCERTRREVLGLLLERAGLQCEQQGKQLILKRHWTGLESFRCLLKDNSFVKPCD